jgi:hypothetical protein
MQIAKTASTAKSSKSARTHSGPAAFLSHPAAEQYLESLQELVHELDRAMEALASRTLPAFESSVSNQLDLCTRLANRPAQRVDSSAQFPGPPVTEAEAELAQRIASATATLLSLNKRYSALLKHSGDTMRLFAGLFRGYPGQTLPQPPASSHLTSWSCQL